MKSSKLDFHTVLAASGRAPEIPESGDITHQKLSIAEGAEFDGRVKLTKDASELMPELDPEAIERTRVNGDASRYETSGHLGERAD